MFLITDKAASKTSIAASAVTGNVSQPVEKSMVTRRANDYASKKSTAANDLESMDVLISFSVCILYIP